MGRALRLPVRRTGRTGAVRLCYVRRQACFEASAEVSVCEGVEGLGVGQNFFHFSVSILETLVTIQSGARPFTRDGRMASLVKLSNVGAALSQLRKQAGFSISEMAKQLGWSKGRISKYENDELGVTTTVLEELAKGLGMEPEVVILFCLNHKYPKLGDSEIGKALEDLIINVKEEKG